MIDLSTTDGKKQAAMLGVAAVILLVAVIFIYRAIFPPSGSKVEGLPPDANGAPRAPNRGLAPGITSGK